MPCFYNGPMRCLQRKLFSWCVGGLLVLGCAAETSSGQLQSQAPPTTQPPAAPGQGRVSVGGEEDNETSPMMRRAAVKAEKQRNEQRQKQIVYDTDKMLQLAHQLKDDMGKNDDKKTLSASAAKKAEEIEKLARSVKDKMKAE